MKILTSVLYAILGVVSLIGILFIAMIIYYYPVIDRLYIQPCNYYPEALKDCR